MEISDKLRKALGPNATAFYSETKGLFIGRIELPSSDPKKRRRREFTAKDEGEFLRKARTLLNRYREAGDLATSSPTVRTWMTYWLENIAAKRVRPKTLAGYRSVVNRQIVEAIGNVKLEKLTGVHIRLVHDYITDNGGSSTYALNAHRVLSKALEDAVREGKINRNPAGLVDAPRKSRTQLQALDLNEAKVIIKRAFLALDAPIYDPEPVRWAAYLLTGQRRGEIIGLEWDRVGDLIDMSWQLQRLSEEELAAAPADFEWRDLDGYGLYWTRPKSEAGKRMLPVVAALSFLLEEHRKRVAPNPWGLVFTHKGRPIDPDWETKRWPKALAEMKVTNKKIRVHDLRHTAVDMLLEAGVPEDVVMELVGHSEVAMTRRYKDPTKMERRTQGMLQLSAFLNPDG
ncbi:site-specific integrase [Agromyces lapidis]|uniref:Tyrosine recombinase XerC n=1 Tax=Agromyces lapidis TaxID=279574 RepID=A0ABV5SP79_9MICO|nr:tyrosine-type recombinase/integrase [Agromyces lapidis]